MPASEAFTGLFLIFFWPLGVLMTLLFCRRWFKKPEFWVCLAIWAPLTTGTFHGIRSLINHFAEQCRIEQEIIATERSRDYFINIDDKNLLTDDNGNLYLKADCRLKPIANENNTEELKDDATPTEIYDHTVQDLACSDVSLAGTFSSYETTRFYTYMFSDKSQDEIDGDSFKVSVKKSAFTRSDWEHDELDRPSDLTAKLNLNISNTRLSETMKHSEVIIKYRFSDADWELLKKNHTAYRDFQAAEAERIAKEEQERKEKEEAEKKAEEERIAKEEAEKKAQEEAAKKPATTQQPTTSKPSTSQPSTSKPTTTQPSTSKPTTTQPTTPTTTPKPATQQPAENPNLPLKAICKDGSVSYQDNASLPNYRGMCSGHGGIKTKLGRVP